MPQSFSITDKGLRREMNQDFIFSSDIPLGELSCLYLVADGLGGHQAGEYASKYTVETVAEVVGGGALPKGTGAEKILAEAFRAANARIRHDSARYRELYGMGTTLVACTVEGDTLVAANVGDSRLYVFHGGRLRQVTVDHSLVEEMVRAGTLEREYARTHPERNVITRAVGVEDELRVDFFRVPLSECGIVLMCSDGLTTMLEDSEIEDILQRDITLEQKAGILVSHANRAGGKDNISVILIDTSPLTGAAE